MARDLALERVWRQRVRAHEESGLTICEFCQQEGLVAHQLSWWRSELKRRAVKVTAKGNQEKATTTLPKPTKKTRPSSGAAGQFLSVELDASRAGQASVEVILDRPPRIRVTRGFDAEVLREVVRVLERS